MFPLVTTVQRVRRSPRAGRPRIGLVRKHGRAGRRRTIEVGVMVEAPALAWCIPDLKGRADFISIGTNDLMQYFFAADRGNARVSDRYDILSAPALRFLQAHSSRTRTRRDLQVSICGEAAGRPLEAMAFTALGFRRLSMPASGIGPVKRMSLALDT